MVEYEYLSHTADIKVRAYGRDYADACRSAARALTDLISPIDLITQHEKQAIALRAKNKESLLYDFINELIYLRDAKGFVPCEADLQFRQEGNEVLLEGELRGDQLEKYEHSGDVKAATYHDMLIEHSDNQVVVEFVLDI